MKVRVTIISILLFFVATAMQAQILIGGNVYGGGNAGNLHGRANVTVYAGNIDGNVFGGARQANVDSCTFVHIDGEHMSDTIVINRVYGGNDISGIIGEKVGTAGDDGKIITIKVPEGIDPNGHQDSTYLKTFNTFVLTNKEKADSLHIFIGEVYGGSNGDYTYVEDKTDPEHIIHIIKDSKTGVEISRTDKDFNVPDIDRAYLDMHGGTVAHVFGGGNKATINDATLICINNASDVTTDSQMPHIMTNERMNRMGINTVQIQSGVQTGSSDYQFGRVFGGNNKVDMAIRPTWHLHKGKIRDLYSGGNLGGMTYYDPVTKYGGIFLTIASDSMEINNVYGGCRMADVIPIIPGDNTRVPQEVAQELVPQEHLDSLVLPKGYSARVTILGGNINNVYGGNDISGTVYGGCAVGIHSSIKGDVYGGGNGSYPYTDNAVLGRTDEWGDYYYDVKNLMELSDNATFDGLQSVQALNKFRPNAEKVTVRLISDYPDSLKTIIGGAVYCGGNSATLRSSSGGTPAAQLKIGSCVYADKVFLGSNGANMVTLDMFKNIAGNVTVGGTEYDLSQIDLTQQAQMDEYMKGCEMGIRPEVIFDQPYDGVAGHEGYRDYSTFIGSFFCGGNVGSVNVTGMNTLNFNRPFVIFDKLVGGCNDAYVPVIFDDDGKTALNAAYDGGLIGRPDSLTHNKLTLNLADLRIRPMRWKDESDKSKLLEWNTFIGDEENDLADNAPIGTASEADMNRRFKGGNVYGGCYNSGHINGNIIININHTLMNPDSLFDVTRNESELYGENILTQEAYEILERRTGVILGQQGMDVLGTALNLFGGGKGKDTEIWGSTTINMNGGYVFQVFGGSEEGVIGKGVAAPYAESAEKTWDGTSYYFNGKKYTNDSLYSCTVNLNGTIAGVSKSVTSADKDKYKDMSDCEFIYGGGFLGPICGNTTINLGNGRIFNSFAGSCNADILGHTETYMGRGGVDGEGHDVAGFPFVRDYIYGGNDLGGRILGTAAFTSRVRNDSVKSMMYSSNMPKNVSSYVEYTQGYAIGLFGGCFGTYDYTDPEYKDFFYTTGASDTNASNLGTARLGFTKPRMEKAFVNFRPLLTDDLKEKDTNTISEIYGAGQGYPGEDDRDIMQNSSYVLIDIPKEMENYKHMEVWGAGAWSGLGMKQVITQDSISGLSHEAAQAKLDAASAIIDLTNGQMEAAYGGSYQEGITRRTVVNVPTASTIHINNIFGGAYGTEILPSCDVYESNVNYHNTSENARVTGAIYGGNNNERRTLYTHVDITAPVWKDKANDLTATVYGAGKGVDTWSEYTEVNLRKGAKVYQVYGGGEMGHVLNAESVQKYMQLYSTGPSDSIAKKDPYWSDTSKWTVTGGKIVPVNDKEKAKWKKDWDAAWRIPGYYMPNGDYSNYTGNRVTNLNNTLMVRLAEMDDRGMQTFKYNTNVIIHDSATVVGYAYGGGYGKASTPLSGDVYGNTYIALLGGTVTKDLYAAGTSGSVNNLFGADFTASANAFIMGGSARNVYGGGWDGTVGYHNGDLSTGTTGDQLAETHVVVGKYGVDNFIDGSPTVERNVYGGGEGGAVFGTTNVKMMNGYVGYRYDRATGKYQEKIHDETAEDGVGTNRLYQSGCVFGGGYVDDSYVDETNVVMYGGHVRNALFGGGEIAAVGRGEMSGSTPTIYKAGKTNVTLWEGHVHRNVFGGGRGYNNLGTVGSLHCDGFVFGQTDVKIYGGEVGTEDGMASGYGNVFGGGDVGYVYSAYQEADSVIIGKKSGTRYDNGDEGYYYKYKGSYVNGEYKGQWDTNDEEKILTEDCKVLIEPHPKVIKGGFQANEQSVSKGEYVETSLLNYLKDKNADAAMWSCIDSTGIIIHNAVFAGGNTTSGSTLPNAHANTPSVFGNATASINDVYHRDLITLGTGYTGGLYGDGNLTLVDGYRELNITNYGTDYYSIAKEISVSKYDSLPKREAAYYELKYKCKKDCKDKDGNHYYAVSGDHPKASTITSDDLLAQFLDTVTVDGVKTYVSVKDGNLDILVKDGDSWIPNPNGGNPYWEKSGVLPVYAGRLMNSIQRADFCGVFGSRMVLQGAQDRVPEIVDYTNYTINRVREVSLNQQHSVIRDDLKLKSGGYADPEEVEAMDPDLFDKDNLDKAIHGNYFGIYNVVNYLGALTSDVHFNKPTEDGSPDNRRTENADLETYGPEKNEDGSLKGDDLTYYDWKAKYHNERKRNNGTSFNKVALASGVYLELTSEKSTGKDLYEKDWGYITGVIELDLINVQTGLGGGFVYAKNEHRVASVSGKQQTTLTALNQGAVTRKSFKYDGGALKEWETSGNFVHSTQTIVDDCYNISNRYEGTVNPDGSGAMPAHYWYIKGSVYVYDQYISAYTGAPNAYSETVEIPLTIAAAAHGTMKLLDVQPNLYTYYSSLGNPLNDEQKLTFSEATYYKNDPISYWDWYLLSKSEKDLFVNETMVSVKPYKTNPADADTIKAGKVMLPSDYTKFKNALETKTNDLGNNKTETVEHALYDVATNKWVPADEIFRSSNNMSHDTGYMLTYKVNNPEKWNTWYTEQRDANNIDSLAHEKRQASGDGWEDGPTYHLKSSVGSGIVLGQKQYKLGDLISNDVDSIYKAMGGNKPTSNQATFEPAYIVTSPITTPEGVLNPGFILKKSEADTYPASSVDSAYIVTKTIQMGETDFVRLNTKMTKSEKDSLITLAGENAKLVQEIKDYIQLAYYCTTSPTDDNKNLYGGRYYEQGVNYRGLEAWSSMSEDDRSHFEFNYDALDLLIDKNYGGTQGQKYQYDDANATLTDSENNPAHYSITTPVDYTATYNGDSDLSGFADSLYVKHSNDSTGYVTVIKKGDELVREEYEKLPNEQRHYSGIIVKDGKEVGDSIYVYVVKEGFQYGSTPYAVGNVISYENYISLGDEEKKCVTKLGFGKGEKSVTYYYCRESYTIGEHGDGRPVTNVKGTATTYTNGQTVPVGVIIAEGSVNYEGTYKNLANLQKNFTIHGISPTEVSTLYVSRESDIYDLSKERIITVIYQYDYEESDTYGNITPVSERHVVNIHVNFKSGVPDIEDILPPRIVLPGSKITTLDDPFVTPGAYEVTGGGWELFQTAQDAESHINGIEYSPKTDLLYYYQNNYYVAYYALTYLGKTYSNHVPVRVANYHDLKKVMDATSHHYYIDHQGVERNPKIYINDYSASGENGLDKLKDLFDLSLITRDSTAYNIVGDSINRAGHKLNRHHLLDKRVRGGKNLEFFMRTDIDHTGLAWSPIGSDTICFKGTLHGDGHTISGLSNSLFENLCGSVYNIGVTGSFNTAGVVNTGSGYVENAWIKTSADTPLGAMPHAVFGNPMADSKWKQVVNCYYPESNNSLYKSDTNDHGNARMMADKAFYNGEVAYNLNDFYLNKRYYDGKKTMSGDKYYYFKANADGTLPTDDKQITKRDSAYYPAKPATPTPSDNYYGDVGYVESRYADGDFIYAGGTLPLVENERFYADSETETAGYYYPIWPDDYLFFGQRLNYGYKEGLGLEYQELPSVIQKSNDRLITSEEYAAYSNRVYRAPAYFRNDTMQVAHFNPYAVFAQHKRGDARIIAYQDMTAIDFTGYNDATLNVYLQGWNQWSKTSQTSDKSVKDYAFYPPLLDDGGLNEFKNIDLTQNLLAYADGTADATVAAKLTCSTLCDLPDPVYGETHGYYRTVAILQDPSNVRGHAVVKKESGYTTVKDHFLVDKNDFNAPISYTMGSGKRMWYQRTPAKGEFVDRRKGWDAVSLPFTAELVTTQQKGEITHFYWKSDSSRNDTKTKIGHEYWLRQYRSIGSVEEGVQKAQMTYPWENDGEKMDKIGEDNKVKNTFLWDYYYYAASHQDRNLDFYQTYYKNSREYKDYNLLTRGTPYIIGFPGATYYEFDLSGDFIASNTNSYPSPPAKLDKQTITFASKTGDTIRVSDTEKAGVQHGDYTFYPSYLNERFESASYYTLHSNFDSNNDGVADCSAYRKVSGEGADQYAFRPYFGYKKVSGARGATRGDNAVAQYIIFDDNDSEIKKEEPIQEEEKLENLIVNGGRKVIVVKSNLHEEKEVNIVNMAGVTLAAFTIQPGETITTNVALTGVYIVRTTDGRYTKKVLVR